MYLHFLLLLFSVLSFIQQKRKIVEMGQQSFASNMVISIQNTFRRDIRFVERWITSLYTNKHSNTRRMSESPQTLEKTTYTCSSYCIQILWTCTSKYLCFFDIHELKSCDKRLKIAQETEYIFITQLHLLIILVNCQCISLFRSSPLPNTSTCCCVFCYWCIE